MKAWINAAFVIMASALIAGCGTTLRSNVTTFHDWPAKLPENTYVFERTKAQDASLEYRNYENLIRAELNRLGLMEAPPNATPYLKVNFDYGMQVRDVREVYPVVVNPHWYNPAWPVHRFHHPLQGPFHDPFYDPFWYGPSHVQQREDTYQLYTRQLNVNISRFADDKPLYQAKIINEGRSPSLANVMPYLVHSAFKDFPGPSGVTRQVEMRVR